MNKTYDLQCSVCDKTTTKYHRVTRPVCFDCRKDKQRQRTLRYKQVMQEMMGKTAIENAQQQ